MITNINVIKCGLRYCDCHHFTTEFSSKYVHIQFKFFNLSFGKCNELTIESALPWLCVYKCCMSKCIYIYIYMYSHSYWNWGYLSSQTRVCDIWWHYSRPVGSVGQYLVTEELLPDSPRLWHYLFFLGWG